jgi:hypothetical protein
MTMNRLRRVAGLTIAAGAVVVAGAGPAAAAGTVTPTVQCVFHNTDGSYSAVFGYVNSSTAVTLAIGATNSFAPIPADRGQGTAFAAGTHISVLVTNFTTGNLVWTLDTHTVTANSSTTACASNPNLPVSAGSPAGLVFLIGGSVIAVGFMGRRKVRPLLQRASS